MPPALGKAGTHAVWRALCQASPSDQMAMSKHLRKAQP